MNRIVLDASVAVKWVLREEHGATARRVLATRELLAPHLYLALAEQRNSAMVAADRRFHEAVRQSVWADRIVWIEDVT